MAARRPPTQAEVTQALQRGGQLFAAKKFVEAEQIAQLILRFVPRQPDALHLLGLVTLANGDAVEAEKLLLKALKQLRPHPVLLVNLGNAARAQMKPQKALEYYERALKLNPLHEDVFLERGILHTDHRQFQEAIADFDRLLELNPESLAGYSGAAHAASEFGQFRLAIEYCERAEKQLGELPVDFLAMRAVSHERLSELAEAIAIAERVFERQPVHAAALRVWAKAQRRQFKGQPDKLRSIRARLEDIDVEALAPDEARIIYSELAHLSDETGETDKAFSCFQKQNDKALETTQALGLDAMSYLNEIDTLSAAFQPEVLGRIRQNSIAARNDAERTPVFIVGFPRSGTTLLDQILDAHPDVQVIEERPMVRGLRDRVEKLPHGFPAALGVLRPDQRRKLQERFWDDMKKYGADLNKPVIVDKMPLDLVYIPLIVSVFPNAKIILALRHPADSSLSCFMQDFEMNAAMMNFVSLENTVRLYDCVMTLWRRWEDHLEFDTRQVRYENLIVDLRAEVEPLLNFLGLDWHEAVNDPAAHARARGTIRTPSFAQVTQPIYNTAADRWRRYEHLMKADLPTLESHIRHFGYSL
jgi:tetratricopeptide (TPR) repeat protein